jgi:hypothetical protein
MGVSFAAKLRRGSTRTGMVSLCSLAMCLRTISEYKFECISPTESTCWMHPAELQEHLAGVEDYLFAEAAGRFDAHQYLDCLLYARGPHGWHVCP